ncbi:MAG: hypothetical protein IJZ90_04610 [Clostridia bacterium]|nr:hypothetical protein [Clostridia bacterium]
MSRVELRIGIKKILNLLLWVGIVLPMVYFIYLYIKQLIGVYSSSFGFIDAVFGAWSACADILLKLLIISAVFICLKLLVGLPRFVSGLSIYQKGVQVQEITVAETAEALEFTDADVFFEKYKEFMYNPVSVASLLPAVLYNFVIDEKKGRDMLAILLNIDAGSEDSCMIIDGIKKQISGKKYIPLSYFTSATPENGYKVSSPSVVRIKTGDLLEDDKYEKTLYIACSGSGSYRPVKLRCLKKKQIRKSANPYIHSVKADDLIWVVDDFPSILVNVKPPVV